MELPDSKDQGGRRMADQLDHSERAMRDGAPADASDGNQPPEVPMGGGGAPLDETNHDQVKSLLRKLAIAGVLGALTFAGLSAYGDAATVASDLRDFEYRYLALALILSVGNYLLRAGRWQYYLRHVGVKIPLLESVLVFLAGMVMTITPGKMGELFKSFMLKWTRNTPLAETSAIVVAERVTDLIALVVLAAWGSLLYPGGIILAGLLLSLAVAVVLLASWRTFGRRMISVASRLPLLGRKIDRVAVAYEALVNMLEPGPLLIGIAVAMVAWILQVVGLVVLVFGISEASMTLQQASFIYCSPMLAGVLALLPGGLGVTEAGMAHLLQRSGDWATPATAVAVTILVRLATLWWAVLVGAAAMVLHRQQTGWVLLSETQDPSPKTH